MRRYNGEKLLRFVVFIEVLILFLGVCCPWEAASASNWTVHRLADGSGSISLPPGWKLTYNDFIGSVSVQGPASQSVDLGRGLQVTVPNCPGAQQARAMGGVVAPFSDPLTVLKYIIPQFNELSQRNGGPIMTTDKIISVYPDSSSIPGGKAAWINSAVTRRSNKGVEHLLVMARYECWPGVAGVGWTFYTAFQFVAPAVNIDRDLKTMIQIARSWKVNDQQVTANTQAYLGETNRSFYNSFHAIQKTKDQSEAHNSKGYREGTMGEVRARDPETGDIREVPLNTWNQGRGCYWVGGRCRYDVKPGQ